MLDERPIDALSRYSFGKVRIYQRAVIQGALKTGLDLTTLAEHTLGVRPELQLVFKTEGFVKSAVHDNLIFSQQDLDGERKTVNVEEDFILGLFK